MSTIIKLSHDVGLTPEEKSILADIVSAHEKFIALSLTHPSDLNDWVDAVHRLQNLIAFRVARRVDPGEWWPNGTQEPGPRA